MDQGCGVPEDGALRIWLAADPDAQVTVRQDGTEVKLQAQPSRDGRLFSLTVKPIDSRLVAEVRHDGTQAVIAAATLILRAGEAPGCHKEPLRKFLENDHSFNQQIRRDVEACADSAGASALSRGHSRYVLARLAYEGGELARAVTLMKQAMQDYEQAGLLHSRMQAAYWLSELYSIHQGRVTTAEELLLRLRPLVEEGAPSEWPWLLNQQAQLAVMNGALREALLHTEKGLLWAERLGDSYGIPNLTIQRADVLNQLGRWHEANELVEQLVGRTDLEPCWRANALLTQGRLRAQIWQASGVAPGQELDPSQPLNQALKVMAAGCKQEPKIAFAYAQLAQAMRLQDHPEDVARFVDQARSVLPTGAAGGEAKEDAREQVERELELHFLAGWSQLRLGQLAAQEQEPAARGLFDQARQSFEKMQPDSPHVDGFDSPWWGHVGLGLLAEAEGQREQALARYRKAEEYLDRRSLTLPLGSGRGGFLGRYEWSARLLLRLLSTPTTKGAAERDLAEAFAVLRRARARGIRALALLARVQRLDPATRQRWDETHAAYLRERAELDKLESRRYGLADSEQPAVERERTEREHALLAHVGQALHILGTPEELHSEAAWAFRPPAADEVMLACHPLALGALVTSGEWLCLATDGSGVRATRVKDPASLSDPSALTAALLTPFADKLERARRVTVLQYGALRKIPVHLLPFGEAKQPLGDTRAVAYSLDLPLDSVAWQTRLGPDNQRLCERRAYLLFDADGREPESRRSRGVITDLLRGSGWQIQLEQGGGAVVGSGGGLLGAEAAERGAQLPQRLRQMLTRATLFHYGGEGYFATRSGWRHALKTPDEAGLLIGDVLELAQVPRWVTLFGCETGLSSEETGGIEGLGLAQAFLARGSEWAIGTVSKVHEWVAAEVAQAFYGQLARSSGTADPSVLLTRAVLEVKQRWEVQRRADNQPGPGPSRLQPWSELMTELSSFMLFTQ